MLVRGSNGLFDFLGFDDVNFAPPDDKLCKGGGVIYVPVLLPSNNGGFGKDPIY